MKNQLLEDFGDSQSPLPARPVRPVRPVEAAPPAAAPEPRSRQRAGVWRSRAASPPPRAQATPAPEPPRPAPTIAPEVASFSSPHPDWARPLPPEPAPWTERWGRKALGWTAGLGALAAVVATAAWMYRETQVESTLAVVADHTPAPVAQAPAAPLVAAAPIPDPVPAPVEAELPPLRMLPPEPVAALPAVAPPEEKPMVKIAPERRPLAAAAVKRDRLAVKKAVPKPPRERMLVRAKPTARPAPPRAVVQEPAPPPVDNPLTETLRLCRAAGYHATACLKRGCEATRFGLVCRG